MLLQTIEFSASLSLGICNATDQFTKPRFALLTGGNSNVWPPLLDR